MALTPEEAKSIFKHCCDTLDANNWHYNADEEDLSISLGVSGEDLPMAARIKVNAKNNTIALYSPLPFEIEEKTRVAVAVAVCMINDSMLCGAFDYNFADGSIVYKIYNFVESSTIDNETIDTMIHLSFFIIDKYNDVLLGVSKGRINIEQLSQIIKGD